MILRGLTGAVLSLALLHATAAVAISPADKCVAAKLKVAGKYSFCRLKTDAKVIRPALAPTTRPATARSHSNGQGRRLEPAGCVRPPLTG
jgi:hypothetical protein